MIGDVRKRVSESVRCGAPGFSETLESTFPQSRELVTQIMVHPYSGVVGSQIKIFEAC